MTRPLGPHGYAAATGVSRETMARLETYAELLRRWSARINLVAASTINDPWRRHFLDSAQLLPFVPPDARSLVDVGSGAGFPGLVLAILGVSGVELVEADARKCAFLREAARVAGAAVRVHNARIESLPARPVDVIAARAVTPLDRILVLCQSLIGLQTVCLFPKGKTARQELAVARNQWTMDAACHDSRTDPHGFVLCLRGVARRERPG